MFTAHDESDPAVGFLPMRTSFGVNLFSLLVRLHFTADCDADNAKLRALNEFQVAKPVGRQIPRAPPACQ